MSTDSKLIMALSFYLGKTISETSCADGVPEALMQFSEKIRCCISCEQRATCSLGRVLMGSGILYVEGVKKELGNTIA